MDLNVRAFRTVQEALKEPPSPKIEARKVASRKGGIKGGHSRAISITSERRKEIAQKASAARWMKHKTSK